MIGFFYKMNCGVETDYNPSLQAPGEIHIETDNYRSLHTAPGKMHVETDNYPSLPHLSPPLGV
jgi:hypothetical protein